MSELIDPFLSDLALVVRVADSGGFSAASAVTRIPQATVSRRIALLEEKLNTRLFDRTTRKVALTEPGRRVYEHAKLMLIQGEAAASALEALQAYPSGVLRVTSPVILGQSFVQDIVSDFMETYPDVSIKLELTGRRVDIIEEGFDIAIRVGSLPDSGLALTRLGIATSGFYASPAYLKRAERIDRPDQLHAHPLFLPGSSLGPTRVRVSKNSQIEKLDVTPRMACNDAQPVLSAALRGIGIGQLPSFVASSSVAEGKLIRVLPDWSLPNTEINGLTPSYRGSLPAVRQFLLMSKRMIANIA